MAAKAGHDENQVWLREPQRIPAPIFTLNGQSAGLLFRLCALFRSLERRRSALSRSPSTTLQTVQRQLFNSALPLEQSYSEKTMTGMARDFDNHDTSAFTADFRPQFEVYPSTILRTCTCTARQREAPSLGLIG